jgi:hypothetical protein
MDPKVVLNSEVCVKKSKGTYFSLVQATLLDFYFKQAIELISLLVFETYLILIYRHLLLLFIVRFLGTLNWLAWPLPLRGCPVYLDHLPLHNFSRGRCNFTFYAFEYAGYEICLCSNCGAMGIHKFCDLFFSYILISLWHRNLCHK